MDATTAGASALGNAPTERSATAAFSAYFASDLRRCVQTALGLLWLLVGGLQFQSFMYSKGFINMLTQMAPGQPTWLADSIRWSAHIAASNLTVFNTLFALTQVLLGLGILYRPTVRPALATSCLWALIVWWFGEAFGMLFMNMANPLTGAPGAVILYALIALIVWPGRGPGGLIGAVGARIVWAALWLVMAYLWLLGANSSANATRDAINAAPSGMSWLTTVQHWVAGGAHGNGLPIGLVLALLSAVIGVGVAVNWQPRTLLWVAIVLNLAYWVLGQGFGGIFQGGATDPNAGPLFVLLAVAMCGVVDQDRPSSGEWRARLTTPLNSPSESEASSS